MFATARGESYPTGNEIRLASLIGGRAMYILHRLRAFIRDDSGPTSVEYAVMLALIAMGALIAVQALGNTINAMVEDLHETISGVFPA